MPAQSKAVKPVKAQLTTPSTTPSVVASSSSEPVDVPLVEKKPRKSRAVQNVVVAPTDVTSTSTSSTSAAVSSTSTSTPEPVDVSTVDASATQDSVDTPIMELSGKFYSRLADAHQLISSLKADFRALEKLYLREIKTAQKLSSKRRRKAGSRAPSGFVKPTRISDELALFLEKPSGSEMARTEVTREINKYIRTNKLQDEKNGRKIIPDSKLYTLLKLTSNDNLTYFNLQKYMSHHFAKANKEAVV